MQQSFVRIGSAGEVFPARFESSLPRGRRVIVRTSRGVELAEVLSDCRSQRPPDQTLRILRPTTEEDELLIRRLQRHKRQAIENCRVALAEIGSDVVLLDVDQVFDGGTLVMHFLGEPNEEAESITQRIVAEYESIVQTRHFAKLLKEGCGPGCGTDAASGCSGGCAGCAVGCKS